MAGHSDDHYVPVDPVKEAKRLADRGDFDPPANGDDCVRCQGRNGGVPGNENMLDGEPVCDYCTAVDIPPYSREQTEGWAFRAGVIPFKVGIFDEDGLVVTLPVHAASALDARCIAYIIDRGRKMQQWDDEQIELALACTEIVG
jgi:hypothetical protein